MFSGLKETIEEDAKTLVYESMKKEIKVIASPERKFAAWLGGSILSSSLTMFIYKFNMKKVELPLYIENSFVNKYYYYLLIPFF